MTQASKRTHHLAVAAMLSAVAAVLQFVEFSIPLIPSFVKLDISDLPALLGTFSLGPVYGVVIQLVKNLLHLPFGSSAGVGELSNFILGAVFVLCAGLVYRKHKSRKGALIGAMLGAVLMAVVSVPSNYFFVYPAYVKVYGMPLEAIRKWEQALSVLPDHKDAAAYLEMARREAAKVPAKVPEPAPAAPSPAGPDPAELQLPQATRLLEQGRAEEALFLFERILHRAPGHPQALQGRDQARARMAAVAPPSVTAVPAPEPEPAALPPAVATAEAPAPRRGPALPEALRKLQLPPWLMNPLTLMGVFFGILILWVAMYFLGQFRSNSRLRSDVQSIRAECLASVARGTEVASLAEDAAEIRREAERCLSEDPFRAYCRAQELLRLNPLDAPAAQLLDRAAKALPLPDPPQGDLRQVDKLLQGGEVEGAERLLYALLRQNPDQAELRARYQGVALALVQAKAL